MTLIPKEIVEASGSPVGRHTPECNCHLAQYGGCAGCKYQLGCGKLSAISRLVTTAWRKGLTFDEVGIKADKILEVKTLSELAEISQ